jgi:hypothetical protein
MKIKTPAPSALAAVGMTRQAAAIPGRSRRNAVTGKLKLALDSMVWEGLKRNDAALAAGLAESSLRFALRKPHVLAYFRAETAALRENLRPRNLHRLDNIADDSKNDMARVGAIKALEQIADQADEKRGHPGSHQLPGLQIVIVSQAPAGAPPAPREVFQIEQTHPIAP